jgi:hypothetical protein
MTLPIRIGFLKKIKYSMALLAGIALLFWPARDIYYRIFHPLETLTMQELSQRGENFYHVKIKDPAYRVHETTRHKFWYITPLAVNANKPLIWLHQDARASDAVEMKDSSLHPVGMPTEIMVSHTDLMPVTNNEIKGMISDIRKKYPDCIIVTENEPTAWWGILLLLVAGLAVIIASLSVLRRKYGDETV